MSSQVDPFSKVVNVSQARGQHVNYRKYVERAIHYGLLSLIAILIVLSLLWIVASSFNTTETVWSNLLPFSWRALLPQDFTVEGYVSLFDAGLGRAILNRLFIALISVILSTLVCAAAGFAFSRFTFRGRGLLFALVVISFMVPGEVTIIQSYILIDRLDWLNTWQALIVPGLASGFLLFLFRQFFAEIPQDLIDAARVDGASWFEVFSRIVLPLSKPVLISAGILIFLGQWNSFFWPMLVAPNPEFRVIQVAISVISIEQEVAHWNQMFASATITMLVPIIITLPLQRYYVGSLVSGGIKG